MGEIRPMTEAPFVAEPARAAVAPQATPADAAVLPGAKRMSVLEHPLAQHALTILRNRHTAPPKFREVCNQLLVLLAIEAIRSLPMCDEPVEVATGVHPGQALAKPVVIFSLNRHSLGLAHGMVDFLPGAMVGTISMDRAAVGHGIEPRLQLNNAPLLDSACVILFDPVVGSGGSASTALDLLRRSGAKDMILLSFIGSLAGLSRVHSSFPDLKIWTAGIDMELDPKRGPLPGLGDFAERLYG
jgi:uracil phosphoribosyltransferase